CAPAETSGKRSAWRHDRDSRQRVDARFRHRSCVKVCAAHRARQVAACPRHRTPRLHAFPARARGIRCAGPACNESAQEYALGQARRCVRRGLAECHAQGLGTRARQPLDGWDSCRRHKRRVFRALHCVRPFALPRCGLAVDLALGDAGSHGRQRSVGMMQFVFEIFEGGSGMAIERHDVGPRMSKAVVHGNTVYLAGIVADNPKGKSVKEQTQDILRQIEGFLKKAGTDKSKLLSANIWITDMAEFAEMNAVWDAWVSPGNTPARATVQARLASPDYKVEIMVVAAK